MKLLTVHLARLNIISKQSWTMKIFLINTKGGPSESNLCSCSVDLLVIVLKCGNDDKKNLYDFLYKQKKIARACIIINIFLFLNASLISQ